MQATCSSILSLVAGCIALAGCAIDPSERSELRSGSLSRLEDPTFAPNLVNAGVWMPWRFRRAAGAGIYFLDSHDASKIPVLFIHGMYGSPRDFRYLISRLERARFEPWFYYYASGDDLSSTVEHLLHEMDALCAHYNVRSLIIVAHSMGGLIAREFVLRTSESHCSAVPVLVTLSTPWHGHRAAAIGSLFWPDAVRSWHDVATRSTYLEGLFTTKAGMRRRLPVSTEHHLLASVGRDNKRGADLDDGVVTVASQLRDAACEDSYRIYRFEETHVGILNSAAVAESINRALATVLKQPL